VGLVHKLEAYLWRLINGRALAYFQRLEPADGRLSVSQVYNARDDLGASLLFVVRLKDAELR